MRVGECGFRNIYLQVVFPTKERADNYKEVCKSRNIVNTQHKNAHTSGLFAGI